MQTSRRGNGGDRGSAADRRARKHYLLREFGTGKTCLCTFCQKRLTFRTVESDRIVPGSKGGTYRRENIQPACRRCNAQRGDKDIVRPSAKRLKALVAAA